MILATICLWHDAIYFGDRGQITGSWMYNLLCVCHYNFIMQLCFIRNSVFPNDVDAMSVLQWRLVFQSI